MTESSCLSSAGSFRRHLFRKRRSGEARRFTCLRCGARVACSVEGCTRQYYAHGLCNLHWCRWWKHGDPFMVKPGNFKHGHGGDNIRPPTSIYRIWRSMKDRCLNSRCESYPHYGGRYEPSNVRWATATEQANNRRGSRALKLSTEQIIEIQYRRAQGERYKDLAQAFRIHKTHVAQIMRESSPLLVVETAEF